MFLGIAPVHGHPSEMVTVGWTFGMPEVDPWDAGLGKGTIAKLDLADGGTTRQFVDRVAGVEEFMSVVAHPGQKTFTAVGYALSGAPVLNAFQATPGGLEDAYLLTFTGEIIVEGGIAHGMSLSPVSGGMRLAFTAAVAGTFQLQRSNDLGETDPWTPVAGLDATASSPGEELSIDIPDTQIPGFFRLLVE
jgi:hypothetical protein